MAFPRQFRGETWFMRLPTGEVEHLSGARLEAAFRCGLVDARTPVRAVAARLWTTLGEAAEIDDTAARGELSSIAPISLESSAPDLHHGHDERRWLVLDRGDPASLGSKLTRPICGLLAAAATLAIVAFANTHLPKTTTERMAAGTSELMAAGPASPAIHILGGHEAPEMLRTPKGPVERLTEEQKQRVQMGGVQRRYGRPTRPGIAAPRGPRASTTSDPFAGSVGRFDPLNGAL